MFEEQAKEYEERKHHRYEDNDYCGDIADGIIQAYQQGAQFGYNKAKEELEKENGQLEKENAELKEQCSILADCNTCHSTCKNENIEMKKQLTKAKELIVELISSLSVVGECEEEECELLNRAEQFLNSEVE